MPFPQPKSRTVDAFSVSHSRPLSKLAFPVVFVLGNVADSWEKMLFHASMDCSYRLKISPQTAKHSIFHSVILQQNAVRGNRKISIGEERDKINKEYRNLNYVVHIGRQTSLPVEKDAAIHKCDLWPQREFWICNGVVPVFYRYHTIFLLAVQLYIIMKNPWS